MCEKKSSDGYRTLKWRPPLCCLIENSLASYSTKLLLKEKVSLKPKAAFHEIGFFYWCFISAFAQVSIEVGWSLLCWSFIIYTAAEIQILSRELTNRRLSHDGAVGSPYSPAPSSCRNLNLRFAVKTTTFMRDRQIFSPFLKFVFIFWEGELLKPNCLTSDKRELVSHTLMEATFNKLINEQVFVLLYDCHKSTNPEFLYWNYDRSDLEEKLNDDCKAKAEFLLHRQDIYFTFHSYRVVLWPP